MTESREPIAYRVESKMPDVAVTASPADVKIEGYIGARIAKNEANRLKEVDLEPLLAGFRHHPGVQAWVGEHIGKWMHAATLAWANTGDPDLKKKLDYAARELIKTQEPDGYLGTYVKSQRFGLYPDADWDVWVHKYCLIGLLTYYRFTGDKPALACCERAGDLLLRTFGDAKLREEAKDWTDAAGLQNPESKSPARKSILSAGTHMGMAATSVLEPMVLLYRSTGEKRYLDFAHYLVRAWDEPGGPHILSTLLSGAGVNKVANGKAYEMLSNLVGLCELARVTGDREYLQAAENAWSDVVKNQLYITGSASHGEVFHGDHDLPDAMGYNVGETCVTVTWMQLNKQLLRLTGDAKYGDEFERSLYDHLAAAQRPDGRQWCYYTSLDGSKPYTDETCCCLSSGPRGMELVPETSYLTIRRSGHSYLAVDLLETSSARLDVGGQEVKVTQTSKFPARGTTSLKFEMAKPAEFGLIVRAPAWARPMRIEGATESDGWMVVPPRRWRSGETVDVTFRLDSRVVAGGPANPGQSALTWGPFVLAYDDLANESLGSPVRYELAGSDADPTGFGLTFRVALSSGTEARSATFVPFAEAGAGGSRYRVWMRAAGSPNPFADCVSLGCREERSAEGNVEGSICDGDPGSFVVTFDGKPQTEAWFSVTLPEPAEIARVVYVHGQSFHDGGWFDASAEKPRIEIRESANGPWVLAGHLEDYPATTATDSHGLRSGEAFSLKLAKPVRAVAIRIVGKPGCGDNPAQSFASCAELEAFSR